MENTVLFHIALKVAPDILEKVDTIEQVEKILAYIKDLAKIKWTTPSQ